MGQRLHAIRLALLIINEPSNCKYFDSMFLLTERAKKIKFEKAFQFICCRAKELITQLVLIRSKLCRKNVKV